MARILFAVSIVPVGVSHLVYVDATVGYVPHWLPYRKGWAYLTGAGQMASGLGVLFNVLPRVAAWAEAGEITLYTLLVWLPAGKCSRPTELDGFLHLVDIRSGRLGRCAEYAGEALIPPWPFVLHVACDRAEPVPGDSSSFVPSWRGKKTMASRARRCRRCSGCLH